MKNMIMTDSFEIKGKWFLHKCDICNKNRHVVGLLCYTPQQIELKLLGIFEDSLSLIKFEDPSESVIYGVSDDGKYLTLLDCIPTHAKRSTSGFGTISYTVNRFFVGTKLLADASSDLTQSVTFSFANLNAWLQYNVLEYGLTDDSKIWQCKANFKNIKGKLSVEIKPVGIQLKEELTYRLCYPKDFFLNETTELIIERMFVMETLPDEPQTMHDMFEYARQLKNLVVLLVGHPMFFTYIDFLLADEKCESSKSVNNQGNHKGRLFFTQIGDIVEAKHLSPKRSNDCLIKKELILNNWDDIVNEWFADSEKFSEITDSYIGDLYLPAYIQTAFLNITRGLEAYHRLYVEKSVDKHQEISTIESSKKQVIDFVNKNIPSIDRDYILPRINYETGESFSKRIKQLINVMPANLRNAVFGKLTSAEHKKLISQIVQTRNYYTHRDKKEKYPLLIETPLEIAKLSGKLSIVLNYFCLTQLGVPKDIVECALSAKWDMEI